MGRNLNFPIRTWGILNPEAMTLIYELGIDGITVNFPDLPDLLVKYSIQNERKD